MADIFHLQLLHGNISNTLKEVWPYVGHVQIAQASNRHEPNVPGELDYNYIFGLLKDLGYDDWIGCEYTPKNGTENGLGWVREMGFEL